LPAATLEHAPRQRSCSRKSSRTLDHQLLLWCNEGLPALAHETSVDGVQHNARVRIGEHEEEVMKLALVGMLTIASPSFAQVAYPPTRTVDVSDTYFGITYKDPYRWLEDLKDQAVQDWFRSQAKLTDDLLARLPGRDALAEEWLSLDRLQPAKYNAILFENGRVFYKKTLGGENVGKLYYRDEWRGAEKLLFDPSKFKPQGAKEGDVTTIPGIAGLPRRQ